MPSSDPSLQDLISSGTLPVGTKLFHPSRGQGGRGFSATVVSGGIRVGSQTYSTPTAAAHSITGKSVDGWIYWKLAREGTPLDALRQKK